MYSERCSKDQISATKQPSSSNRFLSITTRATFELVTEINESKAHYQLSMPAWPVPGTNMNTAVGLTRWLSANLHKIRACPHRRKRFSGRAIKASCYRSRGMSTNVTPGSTQGLPSVNPAVNDLSSYLDTSLPCALLALKLVCLTMSAWWAI